MSSCGHELAIFCYRKNRTRARVSVISKQDQMQKSPSDPDGLFVKRQENGKKWRKKWRKKEKKWLTKAFRCCIIAKLSTESYFFLLFAGRTLKTKQQTIPEDFFKNVSSLQEISQLKKLRLLKPNIQ